MNFGKGERNQDSGHIYEQSLGVPLSSQTEWSALTRSATNFRTQKLESDGADCMVVRPLLMTYLIVAGAITFYSVVYFKLMNSGIGVRFFHHVVPYVISIGAIYYAFHSFLVPSTFDKIRGVFWKGRSFPVKAGHLHVTRLEDIHALQLIQKYVSRRSRPKGGYTGGFHSYELNLVLRDGNRINVMAHGNVEHMCRDAATLASFLGKPIWDKMVF